MYGNMLLLAGTGGGGYSLAAPVFSIAYEQLKIGLGIYAVFNSVEVPNVLYEITQDPGDTSSSAVKATLSDNKRVLLGFSLSSGVYYVRFAWCDENGNQLSEFSDWVSYTG